MRGNALLVALILCLFCSILVNTLLTQIIIQRRILHNYLAALD